MPDLDLDSIERLWCDDDKHCPGNKDVRVLIAEVRRLRERVTELERMRMEVAQGVGEPGTIKVWRDGILVFDGVDRVAALRQFDCTAHLYATFDGKTYENCIRCGARR